MMIYAVIGTNAQTIIGNGVSYTPAENEILMQSERPSAEHIASADGTWILSTPTKEEQIAELDKQYADDKALLREYYTEADMLGDEELKAELSAELTNVNVAYDEALSVIESEE